MSSISMGFQAVRAHLPTGILDEAGGELEDAWCRRAPSEGTLVKTPSTSKNNVAAFPGSSTLAWRTMDRRGGILSGCRLAREKQRC